MGRIGVPGLHLHDLQHTGNMLAAPGASLGDLKAPMGHDEGQHRPGRSPCDDTSVGSSDSGLRIPCGETIAERPRLTTEVSKQWHRPVHGVTYAPCVLPAQDSLPLIVRAVTSLTLRWSSVNSSCAALRPSA